MVSAAKAVVEIPQLIRATRANLVENFKRIYRPFTFHVIDGRSKCMPDQFLAVFWGCWNFSLVIFDNFCLLFNHKTMGDHLLVNYFLKRSHDFI